MVFDGLQMKQWKQSTIVHCFLYQYLKTENQDSFL